MNKIKRALRFILVFAIIFYLAIEIIYNREIQARQRTNDLSNLENYQEIYTNIQELKTSHPNWNFTILYTGLDWNTVLANETTAVHTRSLLYYTLAKGNVSDWVCPDCGLNLKENGSWYCASNKTVSYYMDPRNWLNEDYIFTFETLSFNEGVHTLEGVKTILAGSFMDTDTISFLNVEGGTEVLNKSYAQIIYEAGKINNVSPYHLAARIRQEQGNGGSSLISGNYTYTDSETGVSTTYTGYYNYFNVGASGSSTPEIIKNGLERAKSSGWTNPEYAIHGGASFLKGGYIGNYQDTLYLQKYHVDSASKYSLYNHQYQQNVSAPYTESLDVYDAYESLGILNNSFNFIVPIYENMPNTASVKPGRKISLHTENVVVNTLYSPLTVRSGPSTNYDIKGKVPKGTTIVRIERAEEISSDGRYWDKIFYNNGSEALIGYASREYLKDVDVVEIVNEPATIGVMCNLRNGPGTTKTSVKKILPVGTQVTIIDKVTYKIDGHIWYRVKLQDGTQGYISEAYIQKAPVEKYKIEGTNIRLTPDTKITDIPEAVLEGEIFGTGAKVKIGEQEYTVIMLGDANGDGKITPLDYVKIKNNIMNITKLEGIYSLAGDANRDGNITPLDYVKVKNHIMNMSKISL